SPVMLMDIYSHSSYEITKRYLGIAQEDRDKIYLSAALF
ncbi:MAG: integrase, partial [Oscillospiraceae bacterium]|nr:integrase [Oscillospiraceae bacterium]MCL2569184.1 integrase [Oscillospiraceae bacterium]